MSCTLRALVSGTCLLNSVAGKVSRTNLLETFFNRFSEQGFLLRQPLKHRQHHNQETHHKSTKSENYLQKNSTTTFMVSCEILQAQTQRSKQRARAKTCKNHNRKKNSKESLPRSMKKQIHILRCCHSDGSNTNTSYAPGH